ncbi:MAG: dihydroxy-acid dehydratase [Bilophila wadsworthia]
MTEQSVHNAVAADMALGGSTNTTLHLPAVFGEAELSLSLDIFDDISRKTPNICKLSPAGTQHIEDLHRAGGIPAVMGALLDKGLVHGEALTVTGKTVAENIKELKAHIIDPDVIRIDKPYAKEGGTPSCAATSPPDGAVVKQSAVAPEMMVRDVTAACSTARKKAWKPSSAARSKGDVVVIRYEGPRGGPGMREMLTPTSAIVGMGLGADVALITDGRLAAAAGCGHRPRIPKRRTAGSSGSAGRRHHPYRHPGRKLELVVPEAEIEERRKHFVPWKRSKSRSCAVT